MDINNYYNYENEYANDNILKINLIDKMKNYTYCECTNCNECFKNDNKLHHISKYIFKNNEFHKKSELECMNKYRKCHYCQNNKCINSNNVPNITTNITTNITKNIALLIFNILIRLLLIPLFLVNNVGINIVFILNELIKHCFDDDISKKINFRNIKNKSNEYVNIQFKKSKYILLVIIFLFNLLNIFTFTKILIIIFLISEIYIFIFDENETYKKFIVNIVSYGIVIEYALYCLLYFFRNFKQIE